MSRIGRAILACLSSPKGTAPVVSPNPPFATTGTVPIRWGGAMTFKMLFLIALMAPILLTALGALIHGPDASTTEQD